MNESFVGKIISFLKKEIGALPKNINLDSKLCKDIGIDGEDGIEFLESYFKEFDVNVVWFEPARYFRPEGLTIPYITKTLWKIMNKSEFPGPPEKDLTIGDLVNAVKSQRWDDTDWEKSSFTTRV